MNRKPTKSIMCNWHVCSSKCDNYTLNVFTFWLPKRYKLKQPGATQVIFHNYDVVSNATEEVGWGGKWCLIYQRIVFSLLTLTSVKS